MDRAALAAQVGGVYTTVASAHCCQVCCAIAKSRRAADPLAKRPGPRSACVRVVAMGASVGAQSRVGHREEAIGVEERAGGGDILVDCGGFGSADHLDQIVDAGEHAVAVVLCDVADVLHKMGR